MHFTSCAVYDPHGMGSGFVDRCKEVPGMFFDSVIVRCTVGNPVDNHRTFRTWRPNPSNFVKPHRAAPALRQELTRPTVGLVVNLALALIDHTFYLGADRRTVHRRSKAISARLNPSSEGPVSDRRLRGTRKRREAAAPRASEA
jgi:hypothetical protein